MSRGVRTDGTEPDIASWAQRLAEASTADLRSRLLAELADASLADAQLADAQLADSSGPSGRAVQVAWALKARYDDAKGSDPQRAARTADALSALAEHHGTAEVQALAAWTRGRVALQLDGQMEVALALLDQAVARFTALGLDHIVATVEVNRLHALAMLGRYDAAVETGLRARDALLAAGDRHTAGMIEQNLGNIEHRRGRYHDAERFYRQARARYDAAGDQRQLAQIDNGLANVLALRHEFRVATELYEGALSRASAAGLEVTQAEIENNLGCLALSGGRYDRALEFLERSRRRYAALGMPHKSAIAEKELAEAYLELNLAPEAAEIYDRVIPIFAELGMRAEQAWALAHGGRALLLIGQGDAARRRLAQARALYAAEGNREGEAMVALAEAQLHYAEGDYEEAIAAAVAAETSFIAAETWSRLLPARWLRGESHLQAGRHGEAAVLLEATVRDATAHDLPQVAQRCSTSLGLLAVQEGDLVAAEAHFKHAVEIIEALRAPLPAETFRTAFVADKQTPYAELVRLCLAAGSASTATKTVTGGCQADTPEHPPEHTPEGRRVERDIEAFRYVERARSRALVDVLAGALPARPAAHDPFDARLVARLDELREELNWFYSQMNRPPVAGAGP